MKIGVAEKLLIAAHRLELSGQRPFSAEDLVVAAWQGYPDTFGLAGHIDAAGQPLYPDSNRVFAEIMGAKPIRERGYLEKVGNKTYQVTETGRARAAELISGSAGSQTPAKAVFSRESKDEMRYLLDSRAFSKWRTDRAEEITFMDACSFWGITPRSSAIELNGRLSHVESLLQRSDLAFAAGNVALEHAGGVVSPETVRSLRQMSNELVGVFHSDLGVIRLRTDER